MSAAGRVNLKDSSKENDTKDDSTIENVASQFMQHVQKTETDNVQLSKDKEKLTKKLKDAEGDNRKLEMENNLLKQEQNDLTVRYNKVKEENLQLLKKLADLNKEHESEKHVSEENSRLKESIKELEDSKTRLANMLGDMDTKMQEFNRKMDKQQSVINELKGNVKNEKLSSAKDDEIKKLHEQMKQITKERSENSDSTHEFQSKLNKKDQELKKKEDLLKTLEKERHFLSEEIIRLKDELKAKSKELIDSVQKVQNLTTANKSLEKSNKALKSDKIKLKSNLETKNEVDDDEKDSLHHDISDLQNKLQLMKKSEFAKAELLKSKENHIVDLRNEIGKLRNTSDLVERSLADLQEQNKGKAVLFDKYQDMVNSHKRLLEENRRLRSNFATKSMIETNATTELSELRSKLDKAEENWESAQARVKQLEAWMDDIFKRSNYELMSDSLNDSQSVVSLPNIQGSKRSPRRDAKKKVPPVKRYDSWALSDYPKYR